MHKRSSWQKVKDTLTFPVRAFTLFEKDRWTLSSLATERFDYVAREVRGKCLDIGCGKHNCLSLRSFFRNICLSVGKNRKYKHYLLVIITTKTINTTTPPKMRPAFLRAEKMVSPCWGSGVGEATC